MSDPALTDEDLAIFFTPGAIKDHFEGDTGAAAEWVAAASDEELREVGWEAMTADATYRAFHEGLVLGVEERLEGGQESGQRN